MSATLERTRRLASRLAGRLQSTMTHEASASTSSTSTTRRGIATSPSPAAGTGARPGEPTPAVKAAAGPKGVIDVPSRLLMGPGPANAHPRVLAAQTLPLLGHLHPPFVKIMDEIQDGLRYVFQTDSKNVLMISGTGHGGMEACITNLLEPGETIVVGSAGIWGQRVCDMSARFGAKVVELKCETGKTFSKDELARSLREHKPAVLFLCQGESSTGVHQNLAGLGDLCRETGTLLLIDTVCSLGGVPMYADAWGVDAIYSGTQKVLSGPPGGAPLFFGPRAMEKLHKRKSKPTSYTWDLNLVGDYWGWNDPAKRSYHHTGCVSTWYAMREALALVGEAGLDKMWSEHRRLHESLWEGLRSMGLEPFVKDEADRLATVNTIRVPEGIDWAAVIKNSMDKFNVEIAGGLGPSAGKVWRVGIMGYNATDANVQLVLDAMKDGLKKQGWKGAQ